MNRAPTGPLFPSRERGLFCRQRVQKRAQMWSDVEQSHGLWPADSKGDGLELGLFRPNSYLRLATGIGHGCLHSGLMEIYPSGGWVRAPGRNGEQNH